MTVPQRDAGKLPPMNFLSRLLWCLPLMVVAGFCVFGFIATFEPMPRIAQWSWRAAYVCAGAGSVFAIGWLWLKPRRQR